MNREIKFRAYLPNLNKITYSHTLKEIVDICSLGYPDDAIWIEFTGYKDKNGIEIYESDIVSAFNKSYDDCKSNNAVELVRGCWRLVSKGKNDIPLFNYKPKELLIIGNIYQNPELLK